VQRAREKMEARLMKDGKTGRVLGDNVDLSVPLEELDDGQVEIHEDLPAAYMTALLDDGHELRWRGREPSRVDLTLDKEAGFVRVLGTAHFQLLHPCVRCLIDVPFDVPLTVDLRLVQREKPLIVEDEEEDEAFADDGSATTALEDLNVASFSDGIVAMGDVLREQLFLELPMHPACDSPRARPTGPCSFVEPKSDPGWVDSRWAGLAALRDKLPPGPTPSAPAAPAAKPSAPAVKAVTAPPPKPATVTTTTAPSEAAAKKPAKKKPAKKTTATKKAAPQKKPAPKKAAKKKAAPPKTPAKKKAAPKKAAKAKAPTKKTAKKKSKR
jgi:uncharacterized metal-binding protein YceD (DUF177 family)